MGAYMSWVVAGLIMLAITIFIHKHTFTEIHSYRGPDTYKKVPFPMWLLLLMIIISIIPIINIIAFIIGMAGYLVNWWSDDISFRCRSKWYVKIMELLSKEV